MRLRPIALGLSLFAISAEAFAQTPDPYGDAPPTAAPTPPTSASLREQGRVALAAGDVAGACLLFEQGYQAATREKAASADAPSPDDALFDLADCHEKQGFKDVARSEFDVIASHASSARSQEAAARAQALRAPVAPPPPMQPPPPPAAPFLSGPPAAEPPKEEPAVRVGDFMDTRLSWTLGDDDVLHSTGQAQPLSPNFSTGDRKQYRLFFDNLNSRFGGRENLTHLALYKKMPAFIDDLDTEASMILRLDMAALAKGTGNVNQIFGDAGSFIRVFYHTDGKMDGKEGFSATLWPIDTDRFRLGYLYDLSWGGTNPYINQSIFPRIQGGSPGFRFQYDHAKFSAFAGLKFATISQVEQVLVGGGSEIDEVRLSQTNYGALAGGGVEITENVRVDAGAGYFQQGTFELPDVAGEPVYTFGGSARVFVHDKDMKSTSSVDLRLYRNDPQKPDIIFKPEEYEENKTVWSASVEASQLMQHLKDFDAPGATTLQPARAVAVQGTIKSGYTRASITAIYRDVPFILRNQPSYIPFQTLPDDAKTGNELFFALAADYNFPKLHLTPGVGAGVQLPSTFSSNSVDAFGVEVSRTVTIRDQGNYSILPLNQDAVPIIQARASLKWDISRILSALVWFQYVNDNNGTVVERDPNEGTVVLRSFLDPHFFGFGTSAQARF